MTIQNLLNAAINKLDSANIPDAKTDARLLLEFATGVSFANMLANPDAEVEKEKENIFLSYIDKRLERKPIQLIIGETEFMGIKFLLDGNELIPRQDTEVLVEKVLEYSKDKSNLSLLDVFTGSGCIAISLDVRGSFQNIFAADISDKAIENAKKNAEINKANVTFNVGDMFEPFEGEAFDIITANPPYIKSDECDSLMPEVRLFDPISALDGGDDGLLFYRRIAKEARPHLTKNGILFMEIGDSQAKEVSDIFSKNDYRDIEIVKDYAGCDRVVICRI